LDHGPSALQYVEEDYRQGPGQSPDQAVAEARSADLHPLKVSLVMRIPVQVRVVRNPISLSSQIRFPWETFYDDMLGWG
jgi:hypothetical protein